MTFDFIGVAIVIACMVVLILLWTGVLINHLGTKMKGKHMEKIYWNESEGQIMTKGGKCLYDREDFRRVVGGITTATESKGWGPSTQDMFRNGIVNLEKAVHKIQNDNPQKLKHLQSQISYLQSMLDRRTTEIKRLSDTCDDLSRGYDSRNTDVDKLRLQTCCAAKGHKMVFSRIADFHIKRTRIAGFLDETDIDTTELFIFKCSNCGLEITKTKKELTPTEKDGLKKLKLL
ncbi:MAG: hypothetical protein KAS32_10855 [Candidatus Peribacteraceae bacterium]|nr:hypothetical protein [Candidatus Peribacteraceae bacterium]